MDTVLSQIISTGIVQNVFHSVERVWNNGEGIYHGAIIGNEWKKLLPDDRQNIAYLANNGDISVEHTGYGCKGYKFTLPLKLVVYLNDYQNGIEYFTQKMLSVLPNVKTFSFDKISIAESEFAGINRSNVVYRPQSFWAKVEFEYIEHSKNCIIPNCEKLINPYC